MILKKLFLTLWGPLSTDMHGYKHLMGHLFLATSSKISFFLASKRDVLELGTFIRQSNILDLNIPQHCAMIRYQQQPLSLSDWTMNRE